MRIILAESDLLTSEARSPTDIIIACVTRFDSHGDPKLTLL